MSKSILTCSFKISISITVYSTNCLGLQIGVNGCLQYTVEERSHTKKKQKTYCNKA